MKGEGVKFLKVAICTSGFLYCIWGKYQKTKSLKQEINKRIDKKGFTWLRDDWGVLYNNVQQGF